MFETSSSEVSEVRSHDSERDSARSPVSRRVSPDTCGMTMGRIWIIESVLLPEVATSFEKGEQKSGPAVNDLKLRSSWHSLAHIQMTTTYVGSLRLLSVSSSESRAIGLLQST